MNIDERIEKLTERHEALAMSLELFGRDLELMAERSDRVFERLTSATVAVNEKCVVALCAGQRLAEFVERVNDRALDADERARKAEERAQEASALADKNTGTIQALIRMADGYANRTSRLESTS